MRTNTEHFLPFPNWPPVSDIPFSRMNSRTRRESVKAHARFAAHTARP